MRKLNKSKTIIVLIISVFFMMLLSCSSEDKKLHAYIRHLKLTAIQKNNQKPIPSLKLNIPDSIGYKSKNGRSPFNPETKELNKVTSPLQIYPISMLKFVGTVTENGKVIAYVIAPDTKLYQVKVGDKLGVRNGIVQTVTHDQVVISEQSSEIANKGAKQIVTLQLREE